MKLAIRIVSCSLSESVINVSNTLTLEVTGKLKKRVFLCRQKLPVSESDDGDHALAVTNNIADAAEYLRDHNYLVSIASDKEHAAQDIEIARKFGCTVYTDKEKITASTLSDTDYSLILFKYSSANTKNLEHAARISVNTIPAENTEKNALKALLNNLPDKMTIDQATATFNKLLKRKKAEIRAKATITDMKDIVELDTPIFAKSAIDNGMFRVIRIIKNDDFIADFLARRIAACPILEPHRLPLMGRKTHNRVIHIIIT